MVWMQYSGVKSTKGKSDWNGDCHQPGRAVGKDDQSVTSWG